MFWPLPSKPPTPSEYAVLLYGFCALLVLAGLAGLVVSLLAPAEKHALAVQLGQYSFGSLGFGLFIALAVWLTRRLLD